LESFFTTVAGKVVELGLDAVASFAVGTVGSAFRFGRQFKHLREEMLRELEGERRRYDERFRDWETKAAAGLRLELESIRESIHEVKSIVDRLRDQSGDYSKEAELSAYMLRVGEWMDRVSRSLGRLEGMLGIKPTEASNPPPRPPPLPDPPLTPRPNQRKPRW
jgi:hypothetical protein